MLEYARSLGRLFWVRAATFPHVMVMAAIIPRASCHDGETETKRLTSTSSTTTLRAAAKPAFLEPAARRAPTGG